MDPVTIAALISGGASLLGTGLNIFGQADANKTNLQIAREANKNELMLYNMQNEYNNPINQMARLRSAGLNPNFVI